MATRFVFLILLLLIPLSSALATEQDAKKWRVGIELDVLPYLFDGHYVSVFGGYGHFQGRLVQTELTTPDFVTQSGFDDNDLEIDAFIVDYFFAEGFKGWWVGPGFERWDGAVTETSTGIRKKYSTDVLTVGGGYVFRITKHFYVNPWAAVHIPVGGDKEVTFGQNTFDIEPTPEISVKLGLDF